jgi:protein SCO1/2
MALHRLITIAVLALIGGAAVGLVLTPGALQRLAPAAPSASFGKALVGGPFTLTDQTGRRVTDQDFRGRYMLIYFGYTYCPDVCPSALQVMSAALDKLGPKADKIQPIFITVDPGRDTPQLLGQYVASFHPRLIGLTGSAAEIEKVAKEYRVYARKAQDNKSPDEYLMDHSSIIYFMDPKGEFIAHFTHATPVDAMVQQMGKAL